MKKVVTEMDSDVIGRQEAEKEWQRSTRAILASVDEDGGVYVRYAGDDRWYGIDGGAVEDQPPGTLYLFDDYKDFGRWLVTLGDLT